MVSDIIIVGAGVVGCALARVLSRYHGSITVLEKAGDVAEGARLTVGNTQLPAKLRVHFCAFHVQPGL